ncbi:hypothetical protein R3P38DRAFT_3628034 [Favolaschia claudopus]|uniref:SET domain-containing protein n=1 Tax=Favolaschia claudopus TaxID=2862362 RepID=A0AAV9ZZ69_9AGAR
MTDFPAIEVVDIPGKGKGVVALEFITQGTRIIAEEPTIKLSGQTREDLAHSVQIALSSPSNLEFLLSFPCKKGEDPVSGRFNHFLPCASEDDNACGLFATICRINHTCCSPLSGPNAMYTWREDLQCETLHALRDIAAMEEITVSYIACRIHTDDPPKFLRKNFDFSCSCAGCARPPDQRAHSLARIRQYNLFMESFPTSAQTRRNPTQLLEQLQHNLLAICEEGYAIELSRAAHCGFRLCAMYGDAKNAILWETLSRDCDAVIQGTDTEEYRSSERWIRDPSTYERWNIYGYSELAAPVRII